jgi:WD40 repeat protein
LSALLRLVCAQVCERMGVVLTSGSDGTLGVFSIATGLEVHRTCPTVVADHRRELNGLALEPHRLLCADAGEDGSSVVLDATRWVQTVILEGHRGCVYKCTWLDPSIAATASFDGTVKVWKLSAAVLLLYSWCSHAAWPLHLVANVANSNKCFSSRDSVFCAFSQPHFVSSPPVPTVTVDRCLCAQVWDVRLEGAAVGEVRVPIGDTRAYCTRGTLSQSMMFSAHGDGR